MKTTINHFIYRPMLKWVLLNVFGILATFGFDVLVQVANDTPPTTKGYVIYGLEIATFYANLFWVVPSGIEKGHWLRFSGRLLLLLAINFLLRALIRNGWSTEGLKAFFLSMPIVIITGWRLNSILLFSLVVGFFRAREKKEKASHLAEMERERMESTLMQIQLSPHLLFNSLNFISTYTDEKVPKAAEAVMLLSKITRHTLIDIRRMALIPVEKELEQITNYINLYNLLSEGMLQILYSENVDQASRHSLIPPSLLLTIVDNVLKYGILNDPLHPAKIDISTSAGKLCLATINGKRSNTFSGTGLGLQSVRGILSYYYPERFELTIEDKGEDYYLYLTIEL